LQASLAETCSLPLCQGLAFSAQRSLTQHLYMSKFFPSLFSYWSPIMSDTERALCFPTMGFSHVMCGQILLFGTIVPSWNQSQHCISNWHPMIHLQAKAIY
jgi:hypothetical protein